MMKRLFLCLLVFFMGAVSCIKGSPYRILTLSFENDSQEDVYIETNFPRGLSEGWTIGSKEIMDNRPMTGITQAGKSRLLYQEAFKNDIDAIQYLESLFPDGWVNVYESQPGVPTSELELIEIIHCREASMVLKEDSDVAGTEYYSVKILWSNESLE